MQFKEEIKKSQEEATERMVRKAKREKPYSFTKKGNQAQFEFNEKVVEVLEDAESIVEKVEESVQSHHPIQDNTLEKLKDSLKKGQSLLAERQKLIKLADWSDYGWGVVAEYQLDELAKDSDDEKKMMKAEKEAERKVLKKRKKAEKSVVSKRAALDDRRVQLLYQPGSSGYQFNRPVYVAARQPSIPSI